jgi:hypothetical protein
MTKNTLDGSDWECAFVGLDNATKNASSVVTYSGGAIPLWVAADWTFGCGTTKKKNPNVPKEIHVTPDTGVMVVKWDDETETKVTCSEKDNWDEEIGFAMALAYKTMGGKSAWKNKWWKIVQRRIVYHLSKTQEGKL